MGTIMGELYKQLKEGMLDAISHAKGELELTERLIVWIAKPKQYSANDVKKLRKKLKFSQKLFAAYLNVSASTIRAWESGKSHPSGVANRLLSLIASEKDRLAFYKALEKGAEVYAKPPRR